MSNYSEYIAKLTTSYVQSSMKRADKLNKYLEHISIKNKFTGEVHNLRSDFLGTAKDDYLWLVFQSVYMQNKLGSDYQAVFMTVTLPSTFHPYITYKRGKKLKNPIKNKRYNDSLSTGGDRLNKFFRDLYKDFKVGRKRVKLHYQKVIEPHKTFVPHLHALVYVEPQYTLAFQKHFQNMLKKHYLGKQNDFEVIKDQKRSATYLLKYIKKNLDGSNQHLAHMIDGWKKDNKIRIYTHSQISIPKFIFQKLSRVLKLEVAQGENILEKVEALVDVTINYRDGDSTHQKTFKPSSAKYRAFVDIEITKKTVLKDESISDLISDMRMKREFTVDFYRDLRFGLADFFLFVHSVDDIENDLIYLNPQTFDYTLYFSRYTYSEMIDLFELYVSQSFDMKEIKIYTVKEFLIEDDLKVYYKKSDFELM